MMRDNLQTIADGAHAMVSRDRMTTSARKLRDIYDIVPGAPIFHKEFSFFTLERWYSEGLDRDADLDDLFGFDPPGSNHVYGLGWCEAAFYPLFEEKVVESNDDHELIQDSAGRKLMVFKGRRSGFMPSYVDHPVKDMSSWEELCKWRLNSETQDRWAGFETKMEESQKAAGEGQMIVQCIVGGYMYLRSLFGPEAIMYAFHDMPEVVHACMETWLHLADGVTARHQQHLTFDVVYLAEDICYNHGILCSPATMKEFLIPYYQQLISNIRSRQIDRKRHLYIQVDTDGNALPAIPIYQNEIGMDSMNPFEVASGCDVVEIGRKYPGLVMSGGIDKRVLTKGKDAIDSMVNRIIPVMRERGGYIPTCDHGVPEEVSLENYLHYRRRCLELGA